MCVCVCNCHYIQIQRRDISHFCYILIFYKSFASVEVKQRNITK